MEDVGNRPDKNSGTKVQQAHFAGRFPLSVTEALLKRQAFHGFFPFLRAISSMIERRTWIVGLALLGVAVIASIFLAERFEVGTHLRRCVIFFRDAGPWPFFIAMTILPAVGFPVSLFNVAAGSVFGPTLGVGTVIGCATLALAVNFTGSYWIATRAMRPLLERWVKRLGYAVPELPAGIAWEITLLVRIVPGPPVFLQSYLLALARVPFRIYLLVSLLVQATFLTVTILAGDAFMRGDWRALVLAGGLFFLVGFVLHRLRKRFAAARVS